MKEPNNEGAERAHAVLHLFLLLEDGNLEVGSITAIGSQFPDHDYLPYTEKKIKEDPLAGHARRRKARQNPGRDRLAHSVSHRGQQGRRRNARRS